jgi:hypothetical protein
MRLSDEMQRSQPAHVSVMRVSLTTVDGSSLLESITLLSDTASDEGRFRNRLTSV